MTQPRSAATEGVVLVLVLVAGPRNTTGHIRARGRVPRTSAGGPTSFRSCVNRGCCRGLLVVADRAAAGRDVEPSQFGIHAPTMFACNSSNLDLAQRPVSQCFPAPLGPSLTGKACAGLAKQPGTISSPAACAVRFHFALTHENRCVSSRKRRRLSAVSGPDRCNRALRSQTSGQWDRHTGIIQGGPRSESRSAAGEGARTPRHQR